MQNIKCENKILRNNNVDSHYGKYFFNLISTFEYYALQKKIHHLVIIVVYTLDTDSTDILKISKKILLK